MMKRSNFTTRVITYLLACAVAAMPALAQHAAVVIDRIPDSITLSNLAIPSPESPEGRATLSYVCAADTIEGEIVTNPAAQAFAFVGAVNGVPFSFGIDLDRSRDDDGTEEGDGEDDGNDDEGSSGIPQGTPETILRIEFGDEAEVAPLTALVNAENPEQLFLEQFAEVIEEMSAAGIADVFSTVSSLMQSPEFQEALEVFLGQAQGPTGKGIKCFTSILKFVGITIGMVASCTGCASVEPTKISCAICAGTVVSHVGSAIDTAMTCAEAITPPEPPVEPEPPTPPDGPCCGCAIGEPLCDCAPGLPPC